MRPDKPRPHQTPTHTHLFTPNKQTRNDSVCVRVRVRVCVCTCVRVSSWVAAFYINISVTGEPIDKHTHACVMCVCVLNRQSAPVTSSDTDHTQPVLRYGAVCSPVTFPLRGELRTDGQSSTGGCVCLIEQTVRALLSLRWCHSATGLSEEPPGLKTVGGIPLRSPSTSPGLFKDICTNNS